MRRKKFEDEYIMWLKLSARDIASTLKMLDERRREEIFSFYERISRYPEDMHSPLSHDERARLERILGAERAEKLTNTIFMKTEAAIFAHPIFQTSSSFFDVGVAMHRRFFVSGRWFAVIALNELYIEIASDRMIHYLIEHELIQGEMYEELARMNVRYLSDALKGAYHEAARIEAARKTGISEYEIHREEDLIREIATRAPLVPTGFAATSIFLYLMRNYDTVEHFGWHSRDEKERELERLSLDFATWIDFSIHTFGSFVNELKKLVRMERDYAVEFL
ncbi:MAG: hypothetical protein OCU22_06510 [Canidatus Methanoxibalbensis ujae]|nr:hypothetical protein [Candidatus Methanoxibalbensis ujae]